MGDYPNVLMVQLPWVILFLSATVKDINNLDFRLEINGKTRQAGNTSDMIFGINEIVEYVSRFFTLKTGDLIFTGTPPGVGQLT